MHSKQNYVLHGQHDWRGKETQQIKVLALATMIKNNK